MGHTQSIGAKPGHRTSCLGQVPALIRVHHQPLPGPQIARQAGDHLRIGLGPERHLDLASSEACLSAARHRLRRGVRIKTAGSGRGSDQGYTRRLG